MLMLACQVELKLFGVKMCSRKYVKHLIKTIDRYVNVMSLKLIFDIGERVDK